MTDPNESIDQSPYIAKGYANRMEYLECLAAEYDIEPTFVLEVATLLGENEDFDGLPTALCDYVDSWL